MSIKRRIIVINPRFQYRFAFYICTWILALSAIFPVLLSQSFSLLAEQLMALPGGPEVEQIMTARKQLLIGVYLLEALFVLIVFAMSIFISHRIAGPLYKLNEFFKEGARTGNLKRDLHFRTNDHFKELAENYNAMVEAVTKGSSSSKQ
jgi:methyl-accepting chemotaxis protein